MPSHPALNPSHSEWGQVLENGVLQVRSRDDLGGSPSVGGERVSHGKAGAARMKGGHGLFIIREGGREEDRGRAMCKMLPSRLG